MTSPNYIAKIASKALKKVRRPISANILNTEKTPDQVPLNLFDNEPNFLEDEIKNVRVYAEYGVGSSTRYVLRFSSATLICIDSDAYWMEKACTGYQDSDRIISNVVDIGQTLSWGIPVESGKPKAFQEYTNWIFERNLSPELLLIDGRFRVCCFLTALKNMKPRSKIIFDDYTFRKQYHFVERFLKPKDIKGRQALFEVPASQTWDDEYLEMALDAFRFNLN